jgi:acyl-coenzyme A synthetase/AMP-(fatty) acid ligase
VGHCQAAPTEPLGPWFEDGRLNLAFNCLDRHLPERSQQTALIYDSPATGSVLRFSYAQLHHEVRLTKACTAHKGT